LGRFIGGAVGDGLDKNIKSAYKWLGQNYQPGDSIYIFGFSRGAYTARYVAGMICSYGLADLSSAKLSDDEIWKRVDLVFEADRNSAKPDTLAKIDFFNTPPGWNDTHPLSWGVGYRWRPWNTLRHGAAKIA